MIDLTANAATVRAAVETAKQRVARTSGVTIVAVTKTFPPEAIAAAVAAGFADVGENYVQEGRAKRAAAGDPPGLTWHLIGGLQRNKARAAVAAFDRIHTVDTAELAATLDAEAARAGRRPAVLMQVNVAGDPAKRGATPEQATALAERLCASAHLAFDGLMTIGPADDSPDEARSHFRALRSLRDELSHRLGVELPHLSMGMSDDFEIAVEEGATLIRLGRVLLGERSGGPWREGA